MSPCARLVLASGFFLNMPLLLAYPLVLSHHPWLALGYVNCGLHAWLTLAWGMQWWGLRALCIACAAPSTSAAAKAKKAT